MLGKSVFGDVILGTRATYTVSLPSVSTPICTLELTTTSVTVTLVLPLVLNTFAQNEGVQLGFVLTTAPPSYAVVLSLSLAAFTTVGPTLPFSLRAYDKTVFGTPVAGTPVGGTLGGAMSWGLLVTINGVDVSSKCVDDVTVEIEENAARIAQFSILQPAGTLKVTSYVGKIVTIDYRVCDVSGSPLEDVRVFTGVVDVPSHDIDTGVTSFLCTDLLQEIVEKTHVELMDELIGGYYSEHVTGVADTRWDRAQNRLSSVMSSLTLDQYRMPRVTDLVAKAVADMTFTEADIVSGSVSHEYVNRSSLVNKVEIVFNYRYPRLKKRAAVLSYRYKFNYVEILINGYDVPTRAAILSAINGTGWDVLGKVKFIPVPAGPFLVDLGGGKYAVWVVSDLDLNDRTTVGDKSIYTAQIVSSAENVAEKLCFGFSARIMKRYGQTREEAYDIVVTAPESIEAFGEIPQSDSFAIDTEFDIQNWEAGLPETNNPNRLLADDASSKELLPLVPNPTPQQKETYVDYFGDVNTDRAAADKAIETAVARAKTTIQNSHRQNRVRVTLVANPLIDITKTVAVSLPRLSAKGRVNKVTHKLGCQSGAATTDVEIAVSLVEAVGLYTETPIVAPTPPVVASSDIDDAKRLMFGTTTWVGRSLFTHTSLPPTATGFFTNVTMLSPNYDPSAPAYPVEFIAEAPAIEEESRDAVEAFAEETYTTLISKDLLDIVVV